MTFLKKNILLFVVFVTGACVLIIEVTALRILSPYFGNTIYSASSVIGVILAALSFGYYFGGKYADRHPENKYFFAIIFAGGITTLLIQILSSTLLVSVAYDMPLHSGPLVSSIALFALPGYFLGMLSPFAIKLQEAKFPQLGVGTLSGQVFFFSTLGSILGSFLAGFYLIPNFGISKIIVYTGSLLAGMGLLGLFASSVKKNSTGLVLLIFSLTLALSLTISELSAYEGLVYQKDGVYERLLIIDSEYKDRPARRFYQDRSSSSAIFLDTGELAYEYSKGYKLYKYIIPDAAKVLVIGGGAFTIPKAFLGERDDIQVDVVDIEPSLFELSKKYFGILDDGRIISKGLG